jgi:hypothetical protein
VKRLFSTRPARVTAIGLFFFLSSLLSFPALADEPPAKPEEEREQRLKDLEQKIDVLTKEIEALRIGEAAAPEVSPSHYGLGPAAAKVYAKKGVSIGGYGEVLYQNFSATRQDGAPSNLADTIDLARAVLYFGYKFDDHFVFNSEIEYEHALTASGEGGAVEVEFAYVDWLSKSRAFRARAGLILVPMGILNELHEPPTFLGARRPDVERFIIPATWRELGFGGYGDAGPFSYRLYVLNGLNSAGYSARGIRGGRQEGSLARAEDFACTGRLDYTGLSGTTIGAAFFTGSSDHGRLTPAGESFSGRTTVWDVHAEVRWRGFTFRGLYAASTVSDAAAINQANGLTGAQSVGSRQKGWYLQAGFDVLSLVPSSRLSLTPFVRYEAFDTQTSVPANYMRNPANDVTELTAGVSFKPIENIVLKADWQRIHNAANTGTNQWNLALGYQF